MRDILAQHNILNVGAQRQHNINIDLRMLVEQYS